MLYKTCRPHCLQEHKFSVTFPSSLFMEITPGLPEHEKYCVDTSSPGRTGMHYGTRRSDHLQKHNFGITCPGVLFMETIPGPSECTM
jgi:hypothetical protein